MSSLLQYWVKGIRGLGGNPLASRRSCADPTNLNRGPSHQDLCTSLQIVLTIPKSMGESLLLQSHPMMCFSRALMPFPLSDGDSLPHTGVRTRKRNHGREFQHLFKQYPRITRAHICRGQKWRQIELQRCSHARSNPNFDFKSSQATKSNPRDGGLQRKLDEDITTITVCGQ